MGELARQNSEELGPARLLLPACLSYYPADYLSNVDLGLAAHGIYGKALVMIFRGVFGPLLGFEHGMDARWEAHSHVTDRCFHGVRVPRHLERITIPTHPGEGGWRA